MEILLWALIVLGAVAVILLVIVLFFLQSKNDQGLVQRQIADQEGRLAELHRGESRSLREELGNQLAAGRKEQSEIFDKFREAVQERMEKIEVAQGALAEKTSKSLLDVKDSLAESVNKRMDKFTEVQTQLSDRTSLTLKENREELTKTLSERLEKVEKAQGTLADKLTESVNRGMKEIQTKNDEKLELMRKTVDEKLHQTLETRLSQSFEVVTKQLMDVQKGLVEMQTLAQDVGGLKKALTNVKIRGVFGEVQLGALLEQFLAPDQFIENTPVKPRGSERIEFAVKLPGTSDGENVLLPIDAKFPLEDYQRLVDAYEHGDKDAIESAGKALEQRITSQAQDIKNKYIVAPHTTDFALLFLPVEGLFAEVIRRGSLFVDIQQKYRVTIVGPTTLSAFLNSLQVGFKTLAISKQSSEVWKILGAVRNEFGKFGDALQSVQRNLEHASSNLTKVSDRSRQMERKLKAVEVLPEGLSQAVFPQLETGSEEEDAPA